MQQETYIFGFINWDGEVNWSQRQHQFLYKLASSIGNKKMNIFQSLSVNYSSCSEQGRSKKFFVAKEEKEKKFVCCMPLTIFLSFLYLLSDTPNSWYPP